MNKTHPLKILLVAYLAASPAKQGFITHKLEQAYKSNYNSSYPNFTGGERPCYDLREGKNIINGTIRISPATRSL